MLRIIVDSGSSIKEQEKKELGVEILPMRITLGEKEYLDGIDLGMEEFYHKLIDENIFPKTSLPSLTDAEKMVKCFLKQGDRVLIITISSGISGTYQSLKLMFDEYEDVLVFDSQVAVGGIRFLVQEARKYEEESLDVIAEKMQDLIPRIAIAAIPETLDYLLKGGRLSKTSWMIGKLLTIKPVIGFKDGKVVSLAKKRGIAAAKSYIAKIVAEDNCDPEYGIVASYSYNRENIEDVIRLTEPKYQEMIRIYDDITPTIACHWGPNAFGYVYVRGK